MSDALFFPPLTRLCVPLRTVWRKQRSGLQYWGASWTQKGVYRAHCPHPQFMKGDYSLLISRVVPEDGGVYFCSVEHLGLTTTVTVTLRVMAGKNWNTDTTLGRTQMFHRSKVSCADR